MNLRYCFPGQKFLHAALQHAGSFFKKIIENSGNQRGKFLYNSPCITAQIKTEESIGQIQKSGFFPEKASIWFLNCGQDNRMKLIFTRRIAMQER